MDDDELISKEIMQADFSKTGAQFVKTAFLAGGIGTALLSAVSVAKKLRREAERTFISLDKSARKLQIQAGLTNLQSEKAQKLTAALAQKSGFSIDKDEPSHDRTNFPGGCLSVRVRDDLRSYRDAPIFRS